MTAALERAHLVRSVAEVLSSDAPIASLWARCCPLLAALAGSERVVIALREPTGDRIAFSFSADAPDYSLDGPIHAGTLAGDVLAAGETIVRGDGQKLAVGVPIHFGRMLFGAICFDRIAAYDAEDVTLLESCALYAGARLYHENAVQTSERYARLAFSDGLTGIANRRSFDEAFAREWARAVRDRTPVGIVMLDLDFFKGYNDGYGHQAGDEALRRVAEALAACIKRPGDLLARYGGEEFVVLLPGTDLAGTTVLAESLRNAVAELAIEHEGSSLRRLSLSVGVAAETPLRAHGAPQLLHAADDALYRAKLAGRNRVFGQGYESQTESARPRRMAADNNLPVALSRLIGRREEVAQARSLLADHRLVSIVGTGGTGKTRAAIAVAADVTERFADGVWFVDLSSISDPTLIASTIASHFDAQVPMDDTALESLANALVEKHALLLLDNCEHLIAGVARLAATLLPGCPHLCVLATSREPLGIPGEAVYRLPLLSLPPLNAEPAAAEAMAFDAIALFAERASEANRAFRLTDGNVQAVVQICREVDGIALAIELAASRIGTIDAATLERRIREFRLLGGGDRSAVPRQQTMHAMIGWSYDLLSDAERSLFRRLAIFQGGFTFEAATDVCGTEPIARGDVFELLSGLIRKSLAGDDPRVEGRYRLLESMRAFARERLVDSGELQRVARLHAEYYDAFAQRTSRIYHQTPSREWLGNIEPDTDNLRGALEWALDERGDVLLGASIAAHTIIFFRQILPAEGVRTLRKALACLPPGARPEIEARINNGLQNAFDLAPLSVLRAAGERAVELYRGLGDPKQLAESLRILAQMIGWYFRSERELADALACESIAIARKLGDPIQVALCLRTRGLTIDIADLPAKRAVLEESLELMRRHGNDTEICGMLTWIGDFEFSAGDRGRAFEYGREAVRFGESAGSPRQYAAAVTNLACYAVGLRDWETARSAIERSVAASRKTRQSVSLAFAVQAGAVMAQGLGCFDDAARAIGWCDARLAALEQERQADQSEDLLHRALMNDLREHLGAERLARLLDEGAMMGEDAAVALALSF
jgi:diguanylate cyclase (GGDEF)-like protein